MPNEMIYFDFEKPGFVFTHIRRILPDSMLFEHAHPRFELYYLVSGTRSYFVEDRTYTLHKGDLVLIGPHRLHRTLRQGEGTHERLLLEFDTQFLSMLAPLLDGMDMTSTFASDTVLRLSPEDQNHLLSAFASLTQECRLSLKEQESAWRLRLADLFLLVHRLFRNDAATPDNIETDTSLQPVVQYLQTHFGENLHLSDVATRFHYGVSHLSRKFRAVTGFGFVEYLNILRINAAKSLLSESRLEIGEIAYQCGFAGSTQFGRAFRKATGMPPRSWRRLYGASDN